jgi:LysM repeat protein
MAPMSHLAAPSPRRNYYARISMLLTLGAVGIIGAACGSDNGHANDTLPPIATTTTTTTLPPTTTTIPDTYEILPGDSLSAIAKMFGLSTVALAAFNGITNVEHIEAGQILKIPQPGDLTSTTISSVVDSSIPDTTLVPTSAP